MSADWSERPEGGGRGAIRLIVAIALHCGRRFSRALLYPIALYFFLRRGPERRASREFLTRAFGVRASAWQALRHMYTYAATMLDRVFLLSDSFRRFAVRITGLDELHAQMDRGRGVLLLGAHIGSFEVLRTLSEERPDVRVCVVMDRQQTPDLTATLHALNPQVAANIIDAGGDPAQLALAMHEAARSGALIGLLGDRSRPGESVHEAEFFGAGARFPIAPYLIASMLELPIVLCFGLYRGGNRYDLHFETFAAELRVARAGRRAQLGDCVQRYAARLEHYTRLDPYNWFNFYDFWHRRVDPAAARRGFAPAATDA